MTVNGRWRRWGGGGGIHFVVVVIIVVFVTGSMKLLFFSTSGARDVWFICAFLVRWID